MRLMTLACPPNRKATQSNPNRPMLPQFRPPMMARINAILSNIKIPPFGLPIVWPEGGFLCIHAEIMEKCVLKLRENLADRLVDDKVGAAVRRGGGFVDQHQLIPAVIVDQAGSRIHSERGAADDQDVRLADVIAYINHDIEDAIRAGIIKGSQLPKRAVGLLGDTKSKRITALVSSIVSMGTGKICLSPETASALEELKEFMFENVYRNPRCKSEESKAKTMIEKLYLYFMDNPGRLPQEYLALAERFDISTAVMDYIAGMTDKYCTDVFISLNVPKGWSVY